MADATEVSRKGDGSRGGWIGIGVVEGAERLGTLANCGSCGTVMGVDVERLGVNL